MKLEGMDFPSVSDIWEQHVFIRTALEREPATATLNIGLGNPHYYPDLFGKTPAEVKEYYAAKIAELDLQYCLFLLAAAEAVLRMNFKARVRTKKKDPTSRQYRKIFLSLPSHKKRISVDEHILKSLRRHNPVLKPKLDELGLAFDLRHWLAHGRCWNWDKKVKADPVSISGLITHIFQSLNLPVA